MRCTGLRAPHPSPRRAKACSSWQRRYLRRETASVCNLMFTPHNHRRRLRSRVAMSHQLVGTDSISEQEAISRYSFGRLVIVTMGSERGEGGGGGRITRFDRFISLSEMFGNLPSNVLTKQSHSAFGSENPVTSWFKMPKRERNVRQGCVPDTSRHARPARRSRTMGTAVPRLRTSRGMQVSSVSGTKAKRRPSPARA